MACKEQSGIHPGKDSSEAWEAQHTKTTPTKDDQAADTHRHNYVRKAPMLPDPGTHTNLSDHLPRALVIYLEKEGAACGDF